LEINIHKKENIQGKLKRKGLFFWESFALAIMFFYHKYASSSIHEQTTKCVRHPPVEKRREKLNEALAHPTFRYVLVYQIQ
jgi:hypothetical protein